MNMSHINLLCVAISSYCAGVSTSRMAIAINVAAALINFVIVATRLSSGS